MKEKITKNIRAVLLSIIGLFVCVTPAFAHVIVHPSTVGVATFQEFTMTVPTEQDNPTIAVKLLIPDGLKMVTPNVKPGWSINVVKQGSGEDTKVTEIDWTDGSIPTGQRDAFVFQAKVPAKETELHWKAYQTYQDGTVVAWDHDPKLSKGEDDDTTPPYSITKIVNDLSDKNNTEMTATEKQTNDFPLHVSLIALALSVIALGMQLRKR